MPNAKVKHMYHRSLGLVSCVHLSGETVNKANWLGAPEPFTPPSPPAPPQPLPATPAIDYHYPQSHPRGVLLPPIGQES